MASRREHLREILDREEILLKVRLDQDSVSGRCPIEYRKPDKGYFIAGTEAQIFVGHISHLSSSEGRITLDLACSRVQTLSQYEEALGE